jgi:hypothetical protein
MTKGAKWVLSVYSVVLFVSSLSVGGFLYEVSPYVLAVRVVVSHGRESGVRRDRSRIS